MNNKPRVITKIVPLRFDNTRTTESTIQVPFRVKEIITKTIVYRDDTDPVATPTYGTVESSLVSNQPLGVFMTDYRYASYSGSENIVYKFQNPIDIVGTYTFFYETFNDTTLTGSMLIVLEFVEAEQTALNN